MRTPHPYARRRWSRPDRDWLVALALANTPTRAIARALGRTPDAVRKAASRMRIPLLAHARPRAPERPMPHATTARPGEDWRT
jgi:transposase-like protein